MPRRSRWAKSWSGVAGIQGRSEAARRSGMPASGRQRGSSERDALPNAAVPRHHPAPGGKIAMNVAAEGVSPADIRVIPSATAARNPDFVAEIAGVDLRGIDSAAFDAIHHAWI